MILVRLLLLILSAVSLLIVLTQLNNLALAKRGGIKHSESLWPLIVLIASSYLFFTL